MCPTLCGPMDCGTPGFPVLHHLPELAQTHVQWVDDAIQPFHPLLPPSPPALSLSQYQGFFFFFFFPMSWLFTSRAQSIGASASASVLPVNIQDWFPLGLTGFHDKNEQKDLEWWLQTQDWIPMKLNIVLKTPKGLFLNFFFFFSRFLISQHLDSPICCTSLNASSSIFF